MKDTIAGPSFCEQQPKKYSYFRSAAWLVKKRKRKKHLQVSVLIPNPITATVNYAADSVYFHTADSVWVQTADCLYLQSAASDLLQTADSVLLVNR